MARVSQKKSKKKLWITIPLIIMALLVLVVCGYALSLYQSAKKTVNERMYDPVESIDTEVTKKKIRETEPLHILLLGIDSDSGGRGRSDAIMILSLDPQKEVMQLISIPRDTRVHIVGRGLDDKINHAYAFGGVDMSIATVENFLDIDIDYYVRMNMAGLKQMVDHLGTITVYNDLAWSDGTYEFDVGPTEMDGEKTMRFVRMRKQDPAGDFGRTKRQRQVIQGIIERGASIESVTKIDGMIDILGDNMATNLDFEDMRRLLSGYADTRKNFIDYQVKGQGTTIDGIYYMVVDEEEIAKVKGKLEDIGS